MYREFFGLSEAPFSIAPNPKYLFISDRHGEALTRLTYQLSEGEGGFMLLTGEVGMGKTTVSRYLLRQLPKNVCVGCLQHPRVAETDLHRAVCDAFQLENTQDETTHSLFHRIEAFLRLNHSRNQKTLLLLDEAQHLSPTVLEQLRLLTNIETDDCKLLQVLLIGQPELNQLLELSQLRQLAQRITARYHLMPLTCEELDAYVRYRLQVASCLQPIFKQQAVRALYKVTQGVPRLINLVADQALLCAAQKQYRRIDAAVIDQASANVLAIQPKRKSRSTGPQTTQPFAFSMLGMVAILLGWFAWGFWGVQPPPMRETQITAVPAPVTEEIMQEFDSFASNQGSQAHALQVLFKLWGFDVPLAESHKETGSRVNLRYWAKDLSLFRIREINHPVIVALKNERGRPFYAVLSHLDATRATLLIADSRWDVSVDWLNAHRIAHTSLLWKLPPGDQALIGFRANVDSVQWLEEKTSLLLQEPKRYLTRFDATLKARVKRLQAMFDLEEDGIAGVQTLLFINARTDIAMPRLEG